MENTKYNDVEILVSVTNEKRKPAFAFFNRVVNLNNVDILVEKMKSKGFRVGEQIQVLKAEEAVQEGIPLFDINHNKIEPEFFKDYFVIADGQHRTKAVSILNDYLKKRGEEEIRVPAIEIELKNGETITEYINEINFTKKEWSKEDFLNGAANLLKDNDLLKRYNELIKTAENPKGFPLSTLNLIYTNSSGLSRTDLILLCYGLKEKGAKTKRPIIPAFNIRNGDKFIELCEKAGFRGAEIAKRYLIKEFNNIRTSDSVEFAFSVLGSITSDDVKAMLNIYDHLDEQSVRRHFKVLVEREKKRQTEDIMKINLD